MTMLIDAEIMLELFTVREENMINFESQNIVKT